MPSTRFSKFGGSSALAADRPSRRLQGRVQALALVATVAFAVFLVLRFRQVELAVHLYLVTLAALAAVLVVERALAGVRLADPPTVLSRLRRPPAPRPDRPRPIEALEHAVEFSRARAFDVHIWLRPHLIRVAAHRLAAHHGVVMERDPEAARRLLGDDLWEIVRADRELPERTARGLDAARLRALVEGLERL